MTTNDESSLLSPHLANTITRFSLATRISLRCSSVLVDSLFEVAKQGTLFSLGLSRNALSNMITTAKNLHPSDESSLEKYTLAGLDLVSHTFSLAELFTITGLQLTSRTIQYGLKAAEESVRIFDTLFGSNETSRAIAYIITRLTKELLHDPDFDLAKAGKMAILTGLTKALTAFAVLQNLTHRPIPTTVLYETDRSLPPPYYAQPTCEILYPIARYIHYATAAYGESFMRILGIGDIPASLPSTHHPNHQAFAHHTRNSVDDILLSSYTDPQPLLGSHLKTLVHYVTVDHESQAIVLTCRGTLGLSDLLTDLSFDYSPLDLDGERHLAHSGMLKAAQRLTQGKVFETIRDGLLTYPTYSLVLCGHSLGGGVASLLCVLWAQSVDGQHTTSARSGLPVGRPIHCYAYGPPGVVSISLSQRCAGLVTTVVHGYDMVSCLSLGLLQDFKNVARTLHVERNAAEEIMGRVVEKMKGRSDVDDRWFWATIKTMRADMTAEKMYPPGTVYWITASGNKVRLSRCDDVHARFSEVLFSKSMLMDHSPYMYEKVIQSLLPLKS
ncbi:hypothetical protein G6F46_004424 [Rhizopus delemar]|uniref:sn-1-specific diacylglycerol lipase n=3 Tax=Rhizopus TaxID=4842 RepID=I1CDT1_RHIO9|nr:hypothetical protein RO3G_11322 [Rhizopus delemar RA 99-880]KAG1037795.1 hypothetical protein G6F43_012785 [Rhizopus delemar]KAG1533809.1 hypothetical protein G6F51_012426 [Rhizopus arrhizus]KAG1444358.1 hypothetical protein G6F55_012351 [Rhizopus delemar]KAG1487795.1 hypothetical protein G6F54_012442 [Rhizopus delemar]|eukprot:EIE86611.1 hypothetical protein RO3G_11322 [Rhizopus delemar RA 99-880]